MTLIPVTKYAYICFAQATLFSLRDCPFVSVNEWIQKFESKTVSFTDLKLQLEEEEAVKLGKKNTDAYPFSTGSCLSYMSVVHVCHVVTFLFVPHVRVRLASVLILCFFLLLSLILFYCRLHHRSLILHYPPNPTKSLITQSSLITCLFPGCEYSVLN